MCTNYRPTAREKLFQEFEPIRDRGELPDWPSEVYRDGLAPIIIPDEDGGRLAVVANYSFVPKRHLKGRAMESALHIEMLELPFAHGLDGFWGQTAIVF